MLPRIQKMNAMATLAEQQRRSMSAACLAERRLALTVVKRSVNETDVLLPQSFLQVVVWVRVCVYFTYISSVRWFTFISRTFGISLRPLTDACHKLLKPSLQCLSKVAHLTVLPVDNVNVSVFFFLIFFGNFSHSLSLSRSGRVLTCTNSKLSFRAFH